MKKIIKPYHSTHYYQANKYRNVVLIGASGGT